MTSSHHANNRRQREREKERESFFSVRRIGGRRKREIAETEAAVEVAAVFVDKKQKLLRSGFSAHPSRLSFLSPLDVERGLPDKGRELTSREASRKKRKRGRGRGRGREVAPVFRRKKGRNPSCFPSLSQLSLFGTSILRCLVVKIKPVVESFPSSLSLSLSRVFFFEVEVFSWAEKKKKSRPSLSHRRCSSLPHKKKVFREESCSRLSLSFSRSLSHSRRTLFLSLLETPEPESKGWKTQERRGEGHFDWLGASPHHHQWSTRGKLVARRPPLLLLLPPPPSLQQRPTSLPPPRI